MIQWPTARSRDRLTIRGLPAQHSRAQTKALPELRRALIQPTHKPPISAVSGLWVRGLAEPKHAWTDTNAAPPRLDPVAATAYTLAGFLPSRLLGFFSLRFGLFISNQGDPVRSLTGA